MTRNLLFLATLVAVLLSPLRAHAGVWFEVLHAPCWTGKEDNVKRPAGQEILYGRYKGAIDCFNDDFNGRGARTVLSIKAFQAWEYGTMFLYYDITGPWNGANSKTSVEGADPAEDRANERGGFFGGITTTVSPKRIGEKLAGREFDWGPIADLEIKYEMEHVAKFGMLNYYGLQWSLKQPFFDFVSVTTVIRDDSVFKGIDFQLGAAWQKSFSLVNQDFIFGGFFSWGVFGEGDGVGNFEGLQGEPFFITQPQLLWDFGKPIGFTPGKLYAGFEGQIAFNRYLIVGKSESLLQGMIRWNI